MTVQLAGQGETNIFLYEFHFFQLPETFLTQCFHQLFHQMLGRGRSRP